MSYLEQIELERISQLAFCAFKRELYEKKLNWESLKREAKGELGTFDTYVGKSKKSYTCTYVTEKMDSCLKKIKGTGLLLDITFQLHPPTHKAPYTFNRTLFLRSAA